MGRTPSELIRAVAVPVVAVLATACSTTGDHPNATPSISPSSRSVAKTAEAPSGCVDLARAYEAWAPSALDAYFRPAELKGLLYDGEAFADQVVAVEDVPVQELAGAIHIYTEEVEQLLTEHENGEEPSTFEAELARDVVVEQVQAVARSACR